MIDDIVNIANLSCPLQVDEDAFQALEGCIYSGEYGACEAVPAGEPTGCLVNPTGGTAVDMAGPARYREL